MRRTRISFSRLRVWSAFPLSKPDRAVNPSARERAATASSRSATSIRTRSFGQTASLRSKLPRESPWSVNRWWQIPITNVAFDVFRKDFLPRVGAAWQDGPRNRLNIFGSGAFEAAPLRELWWDGAQWNWTDHDYGPNEDELGPSSLVIPKPPNAYLFGVTAEKDNVLLLAYRPGAGWDFAGGFQGSDGIRDLRARCAVLRR
jgi:hypothetical protein